MGLNDESRSPYGERGLKCRAGEAGTIRLDGRSPYGERGLKFVAVR